MNHPYWALTFFQSLTLFAKRLLLFVTGNIPIAQWASDEVQIAMLVLLSIACSTVGTFLVLKKSSMVANSLSHTMLIGIVITYLLFRLFGPPPIEGGFFRIDFLFLILSAVISSLFTLWLSYMLTHLFRVQQDASIGLVFTLLFAIGITLVTLFTRNAHIGVDIIMGNLDAVSRSDLVLASSVAGVSLITVMLLFRPLVMMSFDAAFAKSIGICTRFYDTVLMFLITLTIIVSFRVVGVILVLAMIITPVLIARHLTHRIGYIMIFSTCISIFAGIAAVFGTRHFLSIYDMPLSTSGFYVTLIFFMLITLLALRRCRCK